MSNYILELSKEDVYNLLRYGKTDGNKVYFVEETEFINGEELRTGESKILLYEIRVVGGLKDETD